MRVRSFDSFLAMATHLAVRAAQVGAALQAGLDGIGQGLEDTMRGKIGTYQPASGPFVSWAPLAQATLDRKSAAGYAIPEPLRETGELERSFRHDVEGLTLIAGSTDPKMIFHEMGTANMPPRPVVGPAAFENREAIRALAAAAVLAGVVGRDAARDLVGGDFAPISRGRYGIRIR